MAIDSSVYQNVATAISAYARERWVHARLLSGTSLVNSNVNIDPSGEGFTGQLRWLKEFDATINIPTTSGASTDGTATDISTDIADYIKCARAFGRLVLVAVEQFKDFCSLLICFGKTMFQSICILLLTPKLLLTYKF